MYQAPIWRCWATKRGWNLLELFNGYLEVSFNKTTICNKIPHKKMDTKKVVPQFDILQS